MKKNQLRLIQIGRRNNYKMLTFFSITLCAVLLCSCKKAEDVKESVTTGLDYSKETNWVSLPSVDCGIDVFYVYPTVSSNSTGAMDVANDEERALARGIFKAQASVFESKANIFAPYYRQMSTKVDMSGGGLATDTKEFKQGASDVQDAFGYFIKNLNNDRPFVVAGHSQGTMALIELMKVRFGDDAELKNRLIAAYLIGYTVTDADLLEMGLTAAQNATDIGVVISFNTQSTTSIGGPMLMPGANCINPLNWSTDSLYADSTQNMGAVFFNDATGEFIREVNNYCGAKIDTEIEALLTTIPEEDVETLEFGPYTEGVYHRYDYAFWYRNLQKNIDDRIEAYLTKN
jgi:Protein of unknown function (DUF3089)